LQVRTKNKHKRCDIQTCIIIIFINIINIHDNGGIQAE
jgi:hypothetical protein